MSELMKRSKSIIIVFLIIIIANSHSQTSTANQQVSIQKSNDQLEKHDNNQQEHFQIQDSRQKEHIHDHNCNHAQDTQDHLQDDILTKSNDDIRKSEEYEKKVEQIRKKYNEELDSQTSSEKILRFFQSCQKEIGEWISLPKEKSLKSALESCQIFQHEEQLLTFYEQLSNIGPYFKKQHIENLGRLFRKYKNVAPNLKCLVELRQFENKFFQEKKKHKYLIQFIKVQKQNFQSFPQHRNYSLKGEQTCHLLKVFFEYYYVEVVSSFQTLSTSFMRALTLRSKVFNHFDISYCLSLDTMGGLSQALQDLDINNIYIKIPKVYHELNYLKLKQKCKDQQNKKLAQNLRNALQGLDMFNIMFNEYEPFVQIAAQKFGVTQIRLLARKFAEIIDNKEKYLEISRNKPKQTKNKAEQQQF